MHTDTHTQTHAQTLTCKVTDSCVHNHPGSWTQGPLCHLFSAFLSCSSPTLPLLSHLGGRKTANWGDDFGNWEVTSESSMILISVDVFELPFVFVFLAVWIAIVCNYGGFDWNQFNVTATVSVIVTDTIDTSLFPWGRIPSTTSLKSCGISPEYFLGLFLC